MKTLMPKGYVCWNTDGIQIIKHNVGVLQDDDDYLLAALHQTMQVTQEVGDLQLIDRPEAFVKLFRGSDKVADVDLLNAISDQFSDRGKAQQNLLISVIGDPGSGKSHLVRWLYQELPRREDTVAIWLRRGEGQFAILKKFINDLSELGSSKASELNIKVRATIQEAEETPSAVADRIYGELAAKLRYERDLFKDYSEEDREKLVFLLGEESEKVDLNPRFFHVVNHFKNAEQEGTIKNGIHKVIIGIVEEMNNHPARLDTDPDGAATASRSVFTEDQVKKFLKQYNTIAQRSQLSGIISWIGFALDSVPLITNILNELVDMAVSKIMSADGVDLNSVFTEVREELKHLDKQLAIFMEDFSGISEKGAGLGKLQRNLLDIFTREVTENQAPLRVIMAITENTYRNIEANFQRRNSLVVSVDTALQEGDGMGFLSAYLNVARSTEQALRQAYASLNSQKSLASSWVPNKCSDCPYVEECHTTFGSQNGVGFYPLNQYAGDRLTIGNSLMPAERIARLKTLLILGSDGVSDESFLGQSVAGNFGPMIANVLERRTDDEEKTRIRFSEIIDVENTEISDPISEGRLRNYIHNWLGHVEPDEVERHVFDLPRRRLEASDIYKVEVVPRDVPGGPAAPLEVSETSQRILRIDNWKIASNGAEVRDKMGESLRAFIQNSLENCVKQAFLRQSTGANLAQLSKLIDLEIVTSCFYVEGTESVHRKSGMSSKPVFMVPRNDFGANVAIGAIILKAGGKEVNRDWSPVRECIAVAAVTQFVERVLDEIVGFAQNELNKPGGIYDSGARVVRMKHLCDPQFAATSAHEVVRDWIEGVDEQKVNSGQIGQAFDVFYHSTGGLLELLNGLTAVIQSENENMDPPYRSVERLIKFVDATSASPTELLKGLRGTSDGSLKWADELETGAKSLLDICTPKDLQDRHQLLNQDILWLNIAFEGDSKQALKNISDTVPALLNAAVLEFARPDLEVLLEDLDTGAHQWKLRTEIEKSQFMLELSADSLFLQGPFIDEITVLATKIRKLITGIDKSVQRLSSGELEGDEVRLNEPIDMKVTLSLDGVLGFESE